jgi:hypothetical protein
MKTKSTIESRVSKWEPFWIDGHGDFHSLVSDADVERCVEENDFDLPMVELMQQNLLDLREQLHRDLADIWDRLDRIDGTGRHREPPPVPGDRA